MTESQRDYIKTLDRKLAAKGVSVSSEDYLGIGWETVYKNITMEAASETIEALKEDLKYGRD